jgi:predicted secreted protein
VNFDASATAEVPTDTLTITLFTEEQGPDPTALAATVNAHIEAALAKAKSDPAVQAHSGNYQTFPLYDKANQITGWRIRAELILEGHDFKAVGALAGRLQPALKLSAMTFSLSHAAREEAVAALLTAALDKFQKQAKVIANTLGFPGYALGQIAVRSDGHTIQPIAYRSNAMVAMAESPSPVPTEGGNNTVTVTVSGSIVLGPAK